MVKDPIKKAKNGTYYFRANLGYDSKGKKIQKYRSGFTTKKEAREEYSKLLLMKPEELSENKDKMTFKHYIFEIFLPWYKTQVKLRTYENRLPTIKKHFSYFDKMAVSDIEPIDVQNWQLKLSKKCKSSYVRAVQGLFSVAMDRAIVLGITTTNPSKIIGNVKKQKSKIEFWTKEEFEKVINGDEEYFTCLANITVDEKEYLICENESGIKKVFFYDTNEEDLILLEEDEEDEVLEIWEEEYYDRDKDYMYWNEEFGEYDEVKDEEQDFDDIEEMEDEEDSDDILVGYDDDEEDIDEFLDEFLDE